MTGNTGQRWATAANRKNSLPVKQKVRVIRDIDEGLWQEVSAQSRLEGIFMKDWVEEALRSFLGSEQTRRKRLPDKVNCALCGKELVKDGTAKNRFIVHHDKQGSRNASVAMLVCDKCHRKRHQELGWGIGGLSHEGLRRTGVRVGNFKCYRCRRHLSIKELGREFRKKITPGSKAPWKYKIRRLCKDCVAKGTT